MCILMFIPLTLVAAVAERPRQPRRRSAYRKQAGRTFHQGRSY